MGLSLLLLLLPVLSNCEVIYSTDGVAARPDILSKTMEKLNGDDRLQALGEEIRQRNIRRGLTDPNVLSEEDKQRILDLHNEVRSEVARGIYAGPGGTYQPSACNMNALSWSVALEKLATAWSNQCYWGHDTNSGRQQKLPTYASDMEWQYNGDDGAGENLHVSGATPSMHMISGGTDYGILGGIDGWAQESLEYTYSANSCSGVCGHYTAMVWADTRYVGCGYMKCNGVSSYDWAKTMLTCNYYPAGNFNGQLPYEQGSACSCCDADRQSCTHEGGLCGGGWSSKYNYRAASNSERSTVDRCYDSVGRNVCVPSTQPADTSDQTVSPSKAPTGRPTHLPSKAPTGAPVASRVVVTPQPTSDDQDDDDDSGTYAVQVTNQVIWYTYTYDYEDVESTIEELMFQELAAGYVGISYSVDSDGKTKQGPYCADPCNYIYGYETIPMVLTNVQYEAKEDIIATVESGDYADALCDALTDHYRNDEDSGLRCYSVTAEVESITNAAYIGDTNNDGTPFDTFNLESYDGADIFVLLIFLGIICCGCWCLGWYTHKKKFQKELETELNNAQNFNVQTHQQQLQKQIDANQEAYYFEKMLKK